MIFRNSVPVILCGFTRELLKVPVNVSRCLKGLLSSATVLVSALLTLFGRSVTVLVWNGLSHCTHHGLLKSMFFVTVAFVVPSCTTSGHVLVRLPGLLNVVAMLNSNPNEENSCPAGVLFLFTPEVQRKTDSSHGARVSEYPLQQLSDDGCLM